MVAKTSSANQGLINQCCNDAANFLVTQKLSAEEAKNALVSKGRQAADVVHFSSYSRQTLNANIMTRLLFLFLLFITVDSAAQSDSFVIKDWKLDTTAPAGTEGLTIPSDSSNLLAMMYTPNGKTKHPTLILLHGLPGLERSLDIAQVVRAHGWNVIYFNYRGSWGTEGKFSYRNCVEDVSNIVAYCNKYQDSLKIDTANIVLFGHSIGGWACIKALEQLPQLKKGFALSPSDLYVPFLKTVPNEEVIIKALKDTIANPREFTITSTRLEIFLSVYRDLAYHDLKTDIKNLKGKQIILLTESKRHNALAEAIKAESPKFFDYQVWDTNHAFTNKRASLMNLVISFIDQ